MQENEECDAIEAQTDCAYGETFAGCVIRAVDRSPVTPSFAAMGSQMLRMVKPAILAARKSAATTVLYLAQSAHPLAS